jgi:hypothetical protein
MGDERKDQNLPARPASSLMGQLVRQRQDGGVVPAQQQNTGVAGGGPATGVGGARGAAPPPGDQALQLLVLLAALNQAVQVFQLLNLDQVAQT